MSRKFVAFLVKQKSSEFSLSMKASIEQRGLTVKLISDIAFLYIFCKNQKPLLVFVSDQFSQSKSIKKHLLNKYSVPSKIFPEVVSEKNYTFQSKNSKKRDENKPEPGFKHISSNRDKLKQSKTKEMHFIKGSGRKAPGQISGIKEIEGSKVEGRSEVDPGSENIFFQSLLQDVDQSLQNEKEVREKKESQKDPIWPKEKKEKSDVKFNKSSERKNENSASGSGHFKPKSEAEASRSSAPSGIEKSQRPISKETDSKESAPISSSKETYSSSAPPSSETSQTKNSSNFAVHAENEKSTEKRDVLALEENKIENFGKVSVVDLKSNLNKGFSVTENDRSINEQIVDEKLIEMKVEEIDIRFQDIFYYLSLNNEEIREFRREEAPTMIYVVPIKIPETSGLILFEVYNRSDVEWLEEKYKKEKWFKLGFTVSAETLQELKKKRVGTYIIGDKKLEANFVAIELPEINFDIYESHLEVSPDNFKPNEKIDLNLKIFLKNRKKEFKILASGNSFTEKQLQKFKSADHKFRMTRSEREKLCRFLFLRNIKEKDLPESFQKKIVG